MSLFGDLMNAATAASGATGAGADPASLGHPGLVNALLGLLGDRQSGGLQGLVQLFEQQGLGNLVQSWIGTGPNPPVSAQQVENVLGSGRLASLAQQAGIPPEQASSMVAAVLPKLVDHLTPNGTVDHNWIDGAIGLLRGKMA